MRSRVYLAGSVGLLLILTADARVGNSSESSFCTETKECLLCDLVCKNDDYEVRHYDSVKWVSTDKEAHLMDKAIVTTFIRLFKYITRSNKAGINIDMTVPVIVEETKRISRSFVYTLSFVMPSAHHMTPPQPTDDKVYFTDMSDMKVYVRSYGGWMMSILGGPSVLEGESGQMSGAMRSVPKGISCPFQDQNCTCIVETLSSWNDTGVNEYRMVDLPSVTTSVMDERLACRNRFSPTEL
ncbi:heme-binding protein 2-like [Oncorhynchus kisutch]|uniref:heme-binding protein 2-like n=1 Tax=Oncorhynchus kisutch TaxID=8019 RepID=UPI00099F961D|nr:heme-binding protein 2-like [Oncorhynchus kisutch]